MNYFDEFKLLGQQFAQEVAKNTPEKEPNYYDFDGHLSNGFLGKTEKELIGRYVKPPQKVFTYGSGLDYMLTEPQKFVNAKITFDANFSQIITLKDDFEHELVIPEKDFILMQENARAVLANFPNWKEGEFQKVFRNQITVDGITYNAKIKVDNWFDKGNNLKYNSFRFANKKVLIDLKTTSKETFKEFMRNSFEVFDYVRNAAWYKDVSCADLVVFVIVNRKSDVWFVNFTTKMLQEGRESYEYIIRQAQKRGLLDKFIYHENGN